MASDPFDSIVKACQEIAVEAVKNAAKKTQDKIIEEANDYLQKYYSNYIPKQYKRSYNLHRAITPYWSDNSGAGKIAIEVGVEYRSSVLKGAYHSNSRFHQSGDVWKPVQHTDSVMDIDKIGSDNGAPEPDWILNNFLEGVHPWAQTDSESTNSLMTEFFDNKLPNHIQQYVEDELFAAIVRRL